MNKSYLSAFTTNKDFNAVNTLSRSFDILHYSVWFETSKNICFIVYLISRKHSSVSYLPPSSGSAPPWLLKSRPYMLIPTRILCLHLFWGASWRMHSLTHGSGELGPGLTHHRANQNQSINEFTEYRNNTTQCISVCLTFQGLNNRTSSDWTRPPQVPVSQNPLAQTYQVDPYWSLVKQTHIQFIPDKWSGRKEWHKNLNFMYPGAIAGGMTSTQLSFPTFRVSQRCVTKCASSLQNTTYTQKWIPHLTCLEHTWQWGLSVSQ